MWLVPFITARKSKSNVFIEDNTIDQDDTVDQDDTIDENIEPDSDDAPVTSEVTGRQKWIKKKRERKEKHDKDDIEKESSMSFMTEMTKKDETIDPDIVFGNLIASHIKSLPEKIKYACQAELNQVLFRSMMYSENVEEKEEEPENVV